MPFTATLPAVPFPHFEKVRTALNALLNVMGAAPHGCARIEDEPNYVERLACALVAMGSAFTDAQLKDIIIDVPSWLTEPGAETWVRQLVQMGFDPSLTGQELSRWLAQSNDAGDRPAGNPVFFFQMRSYLQMFRDTILPQLRPDAPSPTHAREVLVLEEEAGGDDDQNASGQLRSIMEQLAASNMPDAFSLARLPSADVTPCPEATEAGRQILRELRQALDSLLRLVSSRFEQSFSRAEEQQVEQLGERVCGLMLAVGFPMPHLPRCITPLREYTPARIPVFFAWERPPNTGPGEVPAGGIGRQWVSAWRTVLIGVEARLRAAEAGRDVGTVPPGQSAPSADSHTAAPNDPSLPLQRFARRVCECELNDLTGHMPPHPWLTENRRQGHRNEGEALLGAAAVQARQLGIPRAEWEEGRQAWVNAVWAVMNGMGSPWRGYTEELQRDAHRESLQRFSGNLQRQAITSPGWLNGMAHRLRLPKHPIMIP